MSVKFRSPLELSAHRAIAHSDAAQTLAVTVAAKTVAHPEHGNGSSNGYVIDGVEGAYLEFTPGNTYKFDQSHSSNSGHPLRFYEDAAKTTAYTTGVTTSGTPGNAGAYTQIIPSVSTPPILYYQCSAHALMGSYTKFGTGSQGDTYTLSATQDGNNVDILLDAGSGTDSTVQLTAGNNITLTRSSAQEVEIAASGGGGGTVTVQKNVYTANGSTTTFNTSTAIANENNVQVYIDGVYQSKDNYTTSGSTVTFSTAPPNTTSVELIHMVGVNGVIARDSFTGTGSTTAYVLSMSISNENATQVYIDGVYQSKDNYTTSGSTLTFSTAPPNGAAVEVVHIKAVAASSLNQNNFTGDGSTTAFTLSQTVTDETNTFVFIQGVYQEKSVYSISGTTLTFTTAPQNGYTVEVMAFGTITVGNQTVTSFNGQTGAITGVNSINGQTGTVTLETGTDWDTSIKTSNFTAVAGKGYFVNTTSGAITVSLPAGTAGDEIIFQDYASTFNANEIIFSANGSEKIQGDTDNYKCETKNASVNLVYQDSIKGWTADNILTTVPPVVVDFLVIAGAGSGAGERGGGGGAGGYRNSYASESSGGNSASESSVNVVLNTNYTVTVGGGGAGGGTGTAGSNSVFSTITSIGGGQGGSGYPSQTGSAGGSGGGGGALSGSNQNASGTANQGHDGGSSGGSSYPNGYYAGGGGGAGSAGGTGDGTNGSGDGGNGLASLITGSSVTRAGGGGGGAGNSSFNPQGPGTGGSGGGGNGVYGDNNSVGGAGTANTGSGGGGGTGGGYGNGGNGGSGLVVLRYSNTKTITIGSGLTGTTATSGSDKITTFTAGTGTISFA